MIKLFLTYPLPPKTIYSSSVADIGLYKFKKKYWLIKKSLKKGKRVTA